MIELYHLFILVSIEVEPFDWSLELLLLEYLCVGKGDLLEAEVGVDDP